MFRCAQLGTRVAKLSQELKEEQEMNRCLRTNQTQLQSQLAEEERKGKENGEVPENLTHIFTWKSKMLPCFRDLNHKVTN